MNTQTQQHLWKGRYMVKMVTRLVDEGPKYQFWIEHNSMDDDEAKSILEPLEIFQNHKYYDGFVSQAMKTFSRKQSTKLRKYLSIFPQSKIYVTQAKKPRSVNQKEIEYLKSLDKVVAYYPFYNEENYSLDFQVIGYFDPEFDVDWTENIRE